MTYRARRARDLVLVVLDGLADQDVRAAGAHLLLVVHPVRVGGVHELHRGCAREVVAHDGCRKCVGGWVGVGVGVNVWVGVVVARSQVSARVWRFASITLTPSETNAPRYALGSWCAPWPPWFTGVRSTT